MEDEDLSLYGKMEMIDRQKKIVWHRGTDFCEPGYRLPQRNRTRRGPSETEIDPGFPIPSSTRKDTMKTKVKSKKIKRVQSPRAQRSWFSKIENCKDFWMDLFSKLNLEEILELSKRWNGVQRWFQDWTRQMESKTGKPSLFDRLWDFPLENSSRFRINQSRKNHVLVHRVSGFCQGKTRYLFPCAIENAWIVHDVLRERRSTFSVDEADRPCIDVEIGQERQAYRPQDLVISNVSLSFKRYSVHSWFQQSSFRKRDLRLSKQEPCIDLGTREWLNLLDRDHWSKGRWCPLRWVHTELHELCGDWEGLESWFIQIEIDLACEEISEDENHIEYENWCWMDLKNRLYLIYDGKSIHRIYKEHMSSIKIGNSANSIHTLDDWVFFLRNDWVLCKINVSSWNQVVQVKRFSRRARLIAWKGNEFAVLEREIPNRSDGKLFSCWIPCPNGSWLRIFIDSFCLEYHPLLDCFCSIKNHQGNLTLLDWKPRSPSLDVLASFDFDLMTLGFDVDKTLFCSSFKPLMTKHKVIDRYLFLHPFRRKTTTLFFLEF